MDVLYCRLANMLATGPADALSLMRVRTSSWTGRAFEIAVLQSLSQGCVEGETIFDGVVRHIRKGSVAHKVLPAYTADIRPRKNKSGPCDDPSDPLAISTKEDSARHSPVQTSRCVPT